MSRLTTREKNLVLICLCLAFAGVIWLYLIQPTWLLYGQDNATLAGLNSRLEELNKFQKDLQENPNDKLEQAKIDELDKKLPNAPETAELLYYLQTAARSHGAVLIELTANEKDNKNQQNSPKQATPSAEGKKELPFTVKAGGTTEAIMGFLQELEKLSRIVWVQQGEIKKADPQSTPYYGPIEAEFKLNSYYLNQNRPYQNNAVPKPAIRGKANPF